METATSTQTQAARVAQDAAHYRDVLHTLIDQGAALAARIHATAIAATTPDSAIPEATVAFDRAARAVRRTIALARHIAEPLAARHSAPGTTRAQARTRLIRGVEDAIHRKHRDRDTEALTREFHERLEDPMLELDLQGRSIEDVIEEISRDLGIAQQGRSYVYKRRTPEDLRALHARATTPSFTLIQGTRPEPPS